MGVTLELRSLWRGCHILQPASCARDNKEQRVTAASTQRTQGPWGWESRGGEDKWVGSSERGGGEETSNVQRCSGLIRRPSLWAKRAARSILTQRPFEAACG